MFPHYLEGDSSQGESLEVSLLPLEWTQDEAFLPGADVILPVAVERTHAGGETGGMLGNQRASQPKTEPEPKPLPQDQ